MILLWSHIISCDVDGNEDGDTETESVSVCIEGDKFVVKSCLSILGSAVVVTVPKGCIAR